MTVRANFQIRDKQQVNDVERVIWLVNDDRTTTRRTRQKLRVTDRNVAAVSQVDDEWLERFGLPDIPKLVSGHHWIVSANRGGGHNVRPLSGGARATLGSQ
jgi:hypothetical protein